MSDITFRAKNFFGKTVEGSGFAKPLKSGKIVWKNGSEPIDFKDLGIIFKDGIHAKNAHNFYSDGYWTYVFLDTLEVIVN